MSTSQAILLIADISGYTKFMRQHAIATSHAKQIIVRLLKTIVRASNPPLQIAEVEGDAVFFYALGSGKDLKSIARGVKEQIVKFFSTFQTERRALQKLHTCECDACDHVGDLKLKLVIHAGEVAIESIEKFKKLFGIDVILVHRFLKNTLPSNEYVMMSTRVFEEFTDFYGLEPERHTQVYEGIGEVETLVFYPRPLFLMIPEMPEKEEKQIPKGLQYWNLKLRVATMLELLGLKKSKQVFRNLPAE